MSTAACLNIYNDAFALPGFLENAAQWCDSIHVLHASPNKKPSTDGTMEILSAWGIKPEMVDIMEGFGVIRTRLIKECGCDWSIILDCDERIPVVSKVLRCHGNDQFPHTLNPQNSVEVLDHSFCHWRWLKGIIDGAGDDYDVVRTCRRAWMDIGMKRPAQNWHKVQDWQARIVKNNGHIGYDPNVKIHERIVDFRTGGEPSMFKIDDTERGLFFDHFSNFFRPMEPKQNVEDISTYEALQKGCSESMWIARQPLA